MTLTLIGAVGLEVSMIDVYSVVEKARKTGKIDKGTNEVTKAIERGVAKAVFYAADVEPKEIVAHLPIIAKEKGIACFEVDSKQKLGIAVGIPVSASAIAVLEIGDTEAELKRLGEDFESGKSVQPVKAEEVKAEEIKEEIAEEVKEEIKEKIPSAPETKSEEKKEDAAEKIAKEEKKEA